MKEYGSYYQWSLPSNLQTTHFMTGRSAIYAVFTALRKQYPEKYIAVYLQQDEYCNSIVDAINRALYKDMTSMGVNDEQLYEIIIVPRNQIIDIVNGLHIPHRNNSILNGTNAINVVYDVNYLGIVQNIVDRNMNTSNDNAPIIIQDYTHALYTNNLYGDVCIASYRKSLPSPHGAIIWCNPDSKTFDASYISRYPTCVSTMKYIMLTMLRIFLMIVKALSLSIYQSTVGGMVCNYPPGKKVWYTGLKWCENQLSCMYYYVGYDPVSWLFYKLYYDQFEYQMRKYRKQVFMKFVNLDTEFIKMPPGYECADFAIPLLTSSNVVYRHICNELAKKYNIYCASYWHTNTDMLHIPNDSRLSATDMEYIAASINNIIKSL